MHAVQLKMARAALGLTVRQAADLGGVSHDTITRIEAGETLKPSTIEKVRAALEDAGVVFIDGEGGGPGVRLKETPAS
jgi:transcriptional regulator with XRE-family HTH domain